MGKVKKSVNTAVAAVKAPVISKTKKEQKKKNKIVADSKLVISEKNVQVNPKEDEQITSVPPKKMTKNNKKMLSESAKLGKGKKSKKSAVGITSAPVNTKQKNKINKNKHLVAISKLVNSKKVAKTSLASKVEKTSLKTTNKKKKKKSMAAGKIIQSETEQAPMSDEETASVLASPENSRKRKLQSNSVETSGSKKACVRQLNPISTEQSIHAAFSKFGNVTSVDLPKAIKSKENKNRGFCFVKFDSEKSTNKVIGMSCKIEVDNKMVSIEAPQCQKTSQSEGGNKSKLKTDDIFVAKLSPDTTKDDIEEYFSHFGAVKKVSLPLSASGRHKSFAFVAFEEKSGIEAALAQPEHEINSNIIVLKPPLSQVKDSIEHDSHSDAAIKSKNDDIFIANLSDDTTEDDIKEYFSQFGNVKKVSLPRNESSKRKNFAFVTFEEESGVEAAIARPKHEINSTVIVLKPPKSRVENTGDEVIPKKAKVEALFVARLSADTTEEDIEEYFSQFGAVQKVSLPKSETESDKHKGFAFVAFEEKSGLEAALAQSKHKINDKKIVVEPPKKTQVETPVIQNDDLPSTGEQIRLFVGKLSSVTNKETLHEHFSTYGKVAAIQLPFNNANNCHKGFAYICFETEGSIEAALAHNHEIDGHQLELKKSKLTETGTKPRQKKKLRDKTHREYDNELFIGNINKTSSTKKSLAEHFGKYGALENINLPQEKSGDGNKGFCFVAFKDETAMEMVLDAEHAIDGQVLYLRKMRRSKAGGLTTKNKEMAKNEDCGDFQ